MSNEGKKSSEIKGTPPPSPDGSIRGIQIGDPKSVKGSYTPTSQAPPPPPPKKK
jgi:hypothetical protein